MGPPRGLLQSKMPVALLCLGLFLLANPLGCKKLEGEAAPETTSAQTPATPAKTPPPVEDLPPPPPLEPIVQSTKAMAGGQEIWQGPSGRRYAVIPHPAFALPETLRLSRVRQRAAAEKRLKESAGERRQKDQEKETLREASLALPKPDKKRGQKSDRGIEPDRGIEEQVLQSDAITSATEAQLIKSITGAMARFASPKKEETSGSPDVSSSSDRDKSPAKPAEKPAEKPDMSWQDYLPGGRFAPPQSGS